VYDVNKMSIIIIVLIAFITTNSLENNSKEKIITEPEVLEVVKEEATEPEVLEVVKEEATEPEVLEVVKTTVDVEDSNKSFINQYLYYIIGLILLISTFGYMYFRSQKNKPSAEFTNTTNDEDKPLDNQSNNQSANETNLGTEQPSEPEVTPEVTEQPSEPEVTPEVTEQPSEPEVTPEVTEQPSEQKPVDEENLTKNKDNK
jgi:cytoskeletal protein RodZ